MTDIYNDWESFAKDVGSSERFHSDWKRETPVCLMLEHVNSECASAFIKRLLTEFTISESQIIEACEANDSIGNTIRSDCGLSKPVGCTSIRYVFHACEILSAIKRKLNHATIVEVGCGYGGLAMMIDRFSEHFGVTIDKYIFYDLPNVQILQKRFISHIQPKFKTVFAGNNDFSALTESNVFLVSAYGLGEFPEVIASHYLSAIVPHTSSAFIIWNSGTLNRHLPSYAQVEDEYPQTGFVNKLVRW